MEKKEIIRSMNQLEKEFRKMVSTKTATVGGVGRVNRKLMALFKITQELVAKKGEPIKSASMKYNLFLDDIRTIEMIYPANRNDFVVIRSYEECIAYLKKNGLPEFMSFDNDLGEDSNKQVLPDGYAVAKWLVNESGFDLRKFKFNVHSANPVAKKHIESLLNNYIQFLNEN